MNINEQTVYRNLNIVCVLSLTFSVCMFMVYVIART